jgi:hypothetical protein
MRTFLCRALLFSFAAVAAGAPAPVDKATSYSSFLYVPHIALASGCNGGYINARGKMADVHDPNPATRGIRLRCGWETEVRIRNKSALPLRIRMNLHSSDRHPFRVAYQSSPDPAIHDLESERDALEFDLVPFGEAGYTFTPYRPWEPSWAKRLAQDWLEEMLGISLSPQTRNAWMTIEILPVPPDPSSHSVGLDDVEATTTYRFRQDGRIATQAAVGTVVPSNRFSFSFISHMSRKIPWADTGLVITNPNPIPVKVALAIRDNQGRDRGVTRIRLDSQEQLAAMLGSLMQLNQDVDGHLTITADSGPVVAIALQESGNKSQMTQLDMESLPPVDPDLN